MLIARRRVNSTVMLFRNVRSNFQLMKNIQSLAFTIVMMLLVFLLTSPLKAQQAIKWQDLSPADEEFTVMVPTPVRSVNRFVPLQVSPILSIPIYDAYADGVRYMILPIDKKALDLPILGNLNSFSSAFQLAVLSTRQNKNNSITREQDLELEGHKGRQYRLHMGDYDGTARIYETEKHFYVLMVLEVVANDSVNRFFESFKLGMKNRNAKSTEITRENLGDSLSESLPRNPWAMYAAASPEGVVSGGVLNAKAVKLSVPPYPQDAMLAGASGMVVVQVLINEQGKVETAKALSGHPLLQTVAVEAALKAEFKPLLLKGQPVRVKGVLLYNFNAAKK